MDMTPVTQKETEKKRLPESIFKSFQSFPQTGDLLIPEKKAHHSISYSGTGGFKSLNGILDIRHNNINIIRQMKVKLWMRLLFKLPRICECWLWNRYRWEKNSPGFEWDRIKKLVKKLVAEITGADIAQCVPMQTFSGMENTSDYRFSSLDSE
jgi:hypothetical protein